jgi:PAS domain S-box-containing protein
LLSGVFFAPAVQAGDLSILILHSYHAEYAWTRNQHAGFVSTLEQETPEHDVSYFAEYLDTKRHEYTPAYATFFADYLQKKFLGYHPDAIYATDDNALAFLIQYRDRLFPDTPVVFSGINNLWLEKQLDPTVFAGVYERKDVVGNVRLALAMEPGLKRLYFLGDGSGSHDLIAEHVRKEMAGHFPDLAFEFIVDGTMSGIREKMAAKGEGAVVLTTLGGLVGPDGNPVPIPVAIKSLAGAGKFKILTMGTNYLTDGVIGGSVVDGLAQGRAAGHVLLQRLPGAGQEGHGETVDANPAEYVFFYPALKQWGIPLSTLPRGSLVLDGPMQTVGGNTHLLLGALLFLILQVVLLLLALPRLRSLKLIRQALHWSERRYDAVARVINDAVIGIDDRGLVTIFNPAAEKMFGYNEEDILGRPLDRLMPEGFRDNHRRRLDSFFSGEPASDLLGQNLELPALRSNGEEFYVELSLSLLRQGNNIKVIAALRDITERRRADDELRRSEARYRALVQTQVEAICRWLPDTTLTYVNEAYCRLYGKRSDQLLGQKFIGRMPGAARVSMEEHIRILMAHPGTLYHEAPVLQSDGSYLWYRWSNTAIVGELGEVMEVQSVGLDITERKKVEEELRESEARFRETADLLPQSVFETDTSGRLTFANRVTLEMTGCTDGDLARGVSVFALMAEADRDRLAKGFDRVLSGETINADECLIEARNGFRFKVMISASPVVRKGRIVGVRGVAVDISDRIVAEQALRQSEKKFKRLFREYQTLLDGIPDPIALVAPDRTVLRTNLSTASMLGLAVQDIPGKKCCALWVDCSCHEEECPVMTSFRTGEVQKMVLKSGDGRSWEVRTFPVMDKAGKTVQVIRYANDITRQIQLREESLRTGQLASLGELAAGVAHEINNPINGIINYAQLLADSLEIAQDDRDILQGIIDEGERIANIVRNLLAFARARKEHKDRMALWDALACSLALTESQLRKDGILLHLDVPDDLPEVIAHGQEIQQVILNLLSNARYALNKKYPTVDPGKTMAVTGRVCEHRGIPSVQMTFHDRGVGIPESVIHKVLDPFYTTKPTGEGTGLGLSISHGIMKDHRGDIVIDSKEGSYTKVTLILPIAPEENHES